MFEAGPGHGSRRRERIARLGACSVVSLTGIALLLPNLTPYLAADQPAVGLGLAALGTVVCLGLTVAGLLLYRSELSTPNAVRIAVWNFLGLVVLGGVLLAHGAYRGALGAMSTADAPAAGNVLVISAAAHVIIGVHDARRVRAEQLAREREKFTVLSRVLRNDATVLIGQSERLATELDGSLADATLHSRSRGVGDLATKVMVEALDRRSESNVHDIVAGAVAGVREAGVAQSPDLTVDVPTDLWLWADHGVETAPVELIENALEHGGERVRVTAEADDDAVRIHVVDDGSSVPMAERDVVTGDSESRNSNTEAGWGCGSRGRSRSRPAAI